MEVKYQPNDDDRQKQTICFTINYSQKHPIAVSDFTKALDGLNQMYNTYVYSQLDSEEFMHLSNRVLSEVWEKEREENGLKYWSAKQRRRWAANHLGKFYIEEIRQGSITGILSDPNTWMAGVGFVGSIASIISLLKSGKRDEVNINSKNKYKIRGGNVMINNVFNVIQLPKCPGQSISIKDSHDEVKIDYEDKQIIESRLDYYLRAIRDCGPVTYRRVWIQIEKGFNGNYYAQILGEPLMIQTRFPIDIRNQYLEEEINALSQDDLSSNVYQVDMDLEMDYVYWERGHYLFSKGIIYHVYCELPFDYFFDLD